MNERELLRAYVPSTVSVLEPLQALKRVSIAFGALAVATCGLAFATDPLPSSDLIGRLASPAVEDRRTYHFARQTVTNDGVALLKGEIPGDATIRGMRWFVNGAPATINQIELHGNQFSIALQLPAGRDGWTVFAIADIGRFTQYVAMREPLFLSQTASLQRPEITSPAYPKARVSGARAALDVATSNGSSTALGGRTVLHWYSGARITFVGWAINVAQRSAPAEVFLAFDQTLLRATVDIDRPDVAKQFANAAYTHSGFTVTIPSRYLRPGLHHVSVLVRNRSGELLLSGYDLVVFISSM